MSKRGGVSTHRYLEPNLTKFQRKQNMSTPKNQIQIYKTEIQENLTEVQGQLVKKEWSLACTKLIRCLVLLEKITELTKSL